jgi:Protein of unknown function (DUF3991)
MFDTEFEAFKTRIDLCQYAAAEGYREDTRYSSQACFCMRHPVTNDKIFIGIDKKDAHYVYWSVRDDKDNGSIIDFVAHRKRLNLRERRAWRTIGEELRPWIGRPAVDAPAFTPLVPSTKDRISVEAKFADMQVALRHPYLVHARALPASLLESPRFAGTLRIDARSNAIFPHYDERGLCGYEMKNHGFTGFSKGGEKGLWSSNDFPDDRCIMFGESAIDVKSYAALFPDPHTRYRSISGKPNPRQPGLSWRRLSRCRAALGSLPAWMPTRMGAIWWAWCGRPLNSRAARMTIEDDEPSGAKDWNELLQARQRDFFLPLAFPACRWGDLDLSIRALMRRRDTKHEGPRQNHRTSGSDHGSDGS